MEDSKSSSAQDCCLRPTPDNAEKAEKQKGAQLPANSGLSIHCAGDHGLLPGLAHELVCLVCLVCPSQQCALLIHQGRGPQGDGSPVRTLNPEVVEVVPALEEDVGATGRVDTEPDKVLGVIEPMIEPMPESSEDVLNGGLIIAFEEEWLALDEEEVVSPTWDVECEDSVSVAGGVSPERGLCAGRLELEAVKLFSI
ncbi:hypothetical protein Q7P37_003867 [Cladosporium fusiforme]